MFIFSKVSIKTKKNTHTKNLIILMFQCKKVFLTQFGDLKGTAVQAVHISCEVILMYFRQDEDVYVVCHSKLDSI